MTMHPPVIVLGMHRSGTSALTGSLEEAGLSLGPVIEDAVDNAKGSRESRRLMTLHDDILERNGGSWDRPPTGVQWSNVHRELRDSVVESFRGIEHWGFKDPRTLLVLGSWLHAVPKARLVGIFRHPVSVARSLQRRNDMPIVDGLALWMTYNDILAWHHDRNGPFPLVEFSDDATDFRDQVRQVARELSLSELPDTFYDPSLRQPVEDIDEDVPGMTRALRVFEALRERREATPG